MLICRLLRTLSCPGTAPLVGPGELVTFASFNAEAELQKEATSGQHEPQPQSQPYTVQTDKSTHIVQGVPEATGHASRVPVILVATSSL